MPESFLPLRYLLRKDHQRPHGVLGFNEHVNAHRTISWIRLCPVVSAGAPRAGSWQRSGSGRRVQGKHSAAAARSPRHQFHRPGNVPRHRLGGGWIPALRFRELYVSRWSGQIGVGGKGVMRAFMPVCDAYASRRCRCTCPPPAGRSGRSLSRRRHPARWTTVARPPCGQSSRHFVTRCEPTRRRCLTIASCQATSCSASSRASFAPTLSPRIRYAFMSDQLSEFHGSNSDVRCRLDASESDRLKEDLEGDVRTVLLRQQRRLHWRDGPHVPW